MHLVAMLFPPSITDFVLWNIPGVQGPILCGSTTYRRIEYEFERLGTVKTPRIETVCPRILVKGLPTKTAHGFCQLPDMT